VQVYIVYACPIGALTEEIEHYFAQSLELYGPNAVHKYMPHCTLTGFFHDESGSLSIYNATLALPFPEMLPVDSNGKSLFCFTPVFRDNMEPSTFLLKCKCHSLAYDPYHSPRTKLL
jgi:hypothetical protein